MKKGREAEPVIEGIQPEEEGDVFERDDRKDRSFRDFWKFRERQLHPVFEEDPTHRQVGKSSGEMAHVGRFFVRLRQKLAQHTWWSRSASESERMLHLTTELSVEWYNGKWYDENVI